MDIKKCGCSDRPLGIAGSRVVMMGDTPCQVLEFACSNKICKSYKKIVAKQIINLLDNTDTTVEEV